MFKKWDVPPVTRVLMYQWVYCGRNEHEGCDFTNGVVNRTVWAYWRCDGRSGEVCEQRFHGIRQTFHMGILYELE
jgi:hypothetical protein